jgi:hypothetical protein
MGQLAHILILIRWNSQQTLFVVRVMYVGHCTFFTDGRGWDDVQNVGILFSIYVANFSERMKFIINICLLYTKVFPSLSFTTVFSPGARYLYLYSILHAERLGTLFLAYRTLFHCVLGIFLCYLDCLIMHFTMDKVISDNSLP